MSCGPLKYPSPLRLIFSPKGPLFDSQLSRSTTKIMLVYFCECNFTISVKHKGRNILFLRDTKSSKNEFLSTANASFLTFLVVHAEHTYMSLILYGTIHKHLSGGGLMQKGGPVKFLTLMRGLEESPQISSEN